MSAANVARAGYAQTVAGVWDLGEGLRFGLGIDDERAARFSLELFGPTPRLVQLRDGALSLIERSVGSAQIEVERREPLGLLMASLAPFRLEAPPTRLFWRVLRTAYALGAPLGSEDGAVEERTRHDFMAALARRDGAGLGFDLARVAEQLVDVIAEQPYFSDGGDPRWWEVGLIVVPLPPEPPALELPRALLLFLRTDPASKALALTALLTVGPDLIATTSQVLVRARDVVCDDDEIDTMEGWT